MKRLTICLLALALVLGLTACGPGGGSDSADNSGKNGSGSADAITTIDDLHAALAERYGDTDWYGDITDITVETYLGADVLVLHTTWYAEDADWTVENDKRTQLQNALSALNPEVAPNIAMVDSNGAVSSLLGVSINNTTTMADAFALPPAPSTPGEFKSWLDAVYGPGGLVTLGANETWYAAIQSVTVEDLGYGTGPELVIRTSIGATDGTQQSLLQMAIATTGSPLLESVSLFYADGVSSAFSSGANPPGQGGFMYLKQ